MLRCLAWDTSSHDGVVALGEISSESVNLLKELQLGVHSSHSEGLLWGIDQLLKEHDLSIQQIDLFIVGVGPGSFTGLRIGMTTARTFAHSLDKPLIGVSSLSAKSRRLAKKLEKENQDSTLVCSMNAFGGEVYSLIGKPGDILNCANEKAWQAATEAVFEPGEFLEKLKTFSAPFAHFGNAFEIYPDLDGKIQSLGTIAVDSEDVTEIEGQSLLELGQLAHKSKAFGETLELTPQYLRGSSAEEKMKKGILKPSSVKSPL